MMLRWMILLSFCVVLTGCVSSVSKAPANAQQVDRSLAQPLPVAVPSAGPGEPQPGFDQEVPAAQNPS